MDFTLVRNQHGTLVLVAVDALGAPGTLPPDTACVSSDPTIATVAPNPGFPEQFLVTGVTAGTVNITATGTNAAGVAISTVFTFLLTAVVGNPVVGFTATLINVA